VLAEQRDELVRGDEKADEVEQRERALEEEA